MDVVDAATRSRMMSGIRGKDTQPEMLVRRFLHAKGMRYRLHDGTLAGRPDLVFPKYRAVVFVHGCYWHRHPGCRFATMPKSNTGFWREKLDANVRRDRRNLGRLRSEGWRCMVIWECETKEPRKLEALARRISGMILTAILT